jgi:hypothetical protein
MDVPYPDNLMRICEAIIVARVEKNLLRLIYVNFYYHREELLYFELIDLIRQPEIVKKITGSYVEFRKRKLEADKKR